MRRRRYMYYNIVGKFERVQDFTQFVEFCLIQWYIKSQLMRVIVILNTFILPVYSERT